MSEHGKKMIAPIVVTILVILYYLLYFGVLMALMDNLALKLLVAIIPATLGVTMLYVCIQRIREIEGGEEDDLSKY